MTSHWYQNNENNPPEPLTRWLHHPTKNQTLRTEIWKMDKNEEKGIENFMEQ
jgi:hypothetical protein